MWSLDGKNNENAPAGKEEREKMHPFAWASMSV
jgi:hypothetical protein